MFPDAEEHPKPRHPLQDGFGFLSAAMNALLRVLWPGRPGPVEVAVSAEDPPTPETEPIVRGGGDQDTSPLATHPIRD